MLLDYVIYIFALQEAEKLFLKAIELSPQDASYNGNLGMFDGHVSSLYSNVTLFLNF